jgi:hypothetical protein
MRIRETISFSLLGLGLVLTAGYLGLFRSAEPNVRVERAFIAAAAYPIVEAVSPAESNPSQPSHVPLPAYKQASVAKMPPPSEPWPDDEMALIEQLQRELVRLGCYAGEPNGRWTPAVALTVREMTFKLNARLPTNSPDPAHLALARAQTDPVCGASHISAQTGGRPDQADRINAAGELAATYRMSLGALEGPAKKAVRARSRTKSVPRTRNWVQQRFIHPLGIH